MRRYGEYKRYIGFDGYKGKLKKITENIGVPPDSWQELDMGYSSPCWIWKGRRNNSNYGLFFLGFESDFAHRYVFECYNGKIPPNMELDHLCYVTVCVNPKHLKIVTRAENLRRRRRNRPNPTLELYQCPGCRLFARITNAPTDKDYIYYCAECIKNGKVINRR